MRRGRVFNHVASFADDCQTKLRANTFYDLGKPGRVLIFMPDDCALLG
jgi:hypothetical protein